MEESLRAHSIVLRREIQRSYRLATKLENDAAEAQPLGGSTEQSYGGSPHAQNLNSPMTRMSAQDTPRYTAAQLVLYIEIHFLRFSCHVVRHQYIDYILPNASIREICANILT